MLASSPSASSSPAAYIAAIRGPNAWKTVVLCKAFGKVVQQVVDLLTGENVHLLPPDLLRSAGRRASSGDSAML